MMNLFSENQLQPSGRYHVRLQQMGQWQTVTIDDMLPTRDNVLPAFSWSPACAIWISLVEKACAKMFGTYSALKTGEAHLALRMLTGAPIDILDMRVERLPELWLAMRYYTARRDVLVADCFHGCDKAEIGLASNHSYTVLSAQDAVERSQDGHVVSHRLVQLRNPWANNAISWNGPFGLRSANWSDELRVQCGVLSAGDQQAGSFWMPFEAFVQYFPRVAVAMVSDPWTVARTPSLHWLSQPIDDKCRRVTGPAVRCRLAGQGEPLLGCLTIHQDSERIEGALPLTACGIALAKVKDGRLVPVSELHPAGAHARDALTGRCTISEINQLMFSIERSTDYIAFPYSTGKMFEGHKRFVLELHVRACQTDAIWHKMEMVDSSAEWAAAASQLLLEQTLLLGELVKAECGLEVVRYASHLRVSFAVRSVGENDGRVMLTNHSAGFSCLLLEGASQPSEWLHVAAGGKALLAVLAHDDMLQQEDVEIKIESDISNVEACPPPNI